MTYPVRITKDPDGHGYNVDIPCLQRAHTCGKTYDEALEMARALVTDIASFDAGRREILKGATPQEGEPFVTISASDALKIMLFNAMLRAKVSVAELARRMGARDTKVRNSLVFGRATKLDTMLSYFRAIDCPIVISC